MLREQECHYYRFGWKRPSFCINCFCIFVTIVKHFHEDFPSSSVIVNIFHTCELVNNQSSFKVHLKEMKSNNKKKFIAIDDNARLAIVSLNGRNDKYLCIYVESSAPNQVIISQLRNAIISVRLLRRRILLVPILRRLVNHNRDNMVKK